MLVTNVRKWRHGRMQRTGTLVGRKVDDKVLVGWSRCKLTTDTFDPELGLKIADGRINTFIEGRASPLLPPSLKLDVDYFIKRCQRYFKTDVVLLVANV